jgi:hypothetical protein
MGTRQGYDHDVTPSLPPPAIVQPAAAEVSYGLVTGRVARGTDRIVVRAGGRTLAVRRLRGQHFTIRVELPLREVSVSVTAVGADGRRSTATVPHVFGLPRAAAPVLRPVRRDQRLSADLRRLLVGYGGTSAVYVQCLTTGGGAAWNARAQFPAASTLKLAIAATVLAREGGAPQPGSWLDRQLRRMLIESDNEAANALEVWLAGSTSSGGRLVTALMASLGLYDTVMYGGYLKGTARQDGIPLRVDDQPLWGIGKRTSARDLAGLVRAVWLASGGLGPLRRVQPGFTAADGRYLLYVLSHVRDRGKLDRQLRDRRDVRVLHKAGWINSARHDNGLVLWRGGVFVAAVLTYRAAGAGIGSDVLAGQVARIALARCSAP